MFWNKYFWPSILVVAFTALLNAAGTYFGLYDSIYWYDFVAHFMGGAWVALFILWVASTQYGTKLRKYISVRNVLIAVFVVGVLWECYELFFHLTNMADAGYTWDTTHDLIMDVLGGTAVVCLYKKSLIV